MNFDTAQKSTRSKLVSTREGTKPLIERTEQEKVRLAIAFLEKRGYIVFEKLITPTEVADLLRCSTTHVANLVQAGSFKPFDIGSRRTLSDTVAKRRRFSSQEVLDWLEQSRGTSKEAANG